MSILYKTLSASLEADGLCFDLGTMTVTFRPHIHFTTREHVLASAIRQGHKWVARVHVPEDAKVVRSGTMRMTDHIMLTDLMTLDEFVETMDGNECSIAIHEDVRAAGFLNEWQNVPKATRVMRQEECVKF